MGNKLLIRAYNVGCGDCVYVRIPDKKDGFHILIDCGTKGKTDVLKKAIDNLTSTLLPNGANGKKRLDLLVATHRHEDHIKGFDSDWFKNIEVKNIWLSQVMDPKHPQAKKVNELHAFAGETMRGLAASGLAMSPEIELLASLYGVSNDQADKLLMQTLPAANGIKAKYVHSGQKGTDLGLDLESGTEIHVLAPERDIDRYYLGKEADSTLRTLHDIKASFASPVAAKDGVVPTNISAADFRLLRSRMLSNALAFAAKDSSIQNNMSVVLLIEWKKRRLLFVGDAEWHGDYKPGKHNGSWNVMWEMHRRTHLKKPIDFLKVGHHGSVNATPPPASDPPKTAEVYKILDTLLPIPKGGKKPTAQAIVSTEREVYDPIPEGALLTDLARRVGNTRNYGENLRAKGIKPEKIWATEKGLRKNFYEKYEREFLDTPQPLRTDLEFALAELDFVDVEIKSR